MERTNSKQSIPGVIHFKRFSRKSYSVFQSLKRQVVIGVLMLPTLAYAKGVTSSVSMDAQQMPQVRDTLLLLQEVEIVSSGTILTQIAPTHTVQVLDSTAIARKAAASVNDLLKGFPSVDVRQRGPFSAQTDVSIRGSNHDQISYHLNGIDISDPQTGHNSADFPIDVTQIEKLEVLEGPQGGLSASSAFLGSVNIQTKSLNKPLLEVFAKGGSYGYYSVGGQIVRQAGNTGHHFAVSRTHYDGYLRNNAGKLNSDLGTTKLFYRGAWNTKAAEVTWSTGLSLKDVGSNTFYSLKYDDQFEHTSKWLTSLTAAFRSVLHPTIAAYWQHQFDRFELFRGDDSKVPFNHNRTDVVGLNIDGFYDSPIGRTIIGGSYRGEYLMSGNLGHDLRTQHEIRGHEGKYYTKHLERASWKLHLQHKVTLENFQIMAGALMHYNTLNETRPGIYPSASLSWNPGAGWRIHAAWSTSMRLPSYTELYYKVGGYKADEHLKTEKVRSWEIGARYDAGALSWKVTGFLNQGRNLIDWIRDKNDPDSPWISWNHSKMNTIGVESQLDLKLTDLIHGQRLFGNLTLGYAFIKGSMSLDEDHISQYTLNYPKHKLTGVLSLNLPWGVLGDINMRYVDRNGQYTSKDGVATDYRPYTVWDLKLRLPLKHLELSAECDNVLSKRYFDYGDIVQPGRTFLVGAKLTY